MNAIVIHPGRQHSHQLALALYQNDALHAYWTGVPAADPDTKGPLYNWISKLSPQRTTSLPGDVVRHNYLPPIARRLRRNMVPPPRQKLWQHRVLGWFDRWSARRLPEQATAVICYENSAKNTFQVAREKGITTILDAASFHHAWQDAFHEPVESADVHEIINRRKDEEIALADHILTVSTFARESYVDADVPSDRVTSVPMGADLSAFAPDGEGASEGGGPFTFLFPGHAGRRKGVDVLLAASERLHQSGHAHRLQFAGGANEGVFAETDAPVGRLGYLDRSDLAAAFRRADVLVLPSRHDSFGRVVVEAMATGLPVLLSEHVGAKEVVTEGETGWVVPAEDVDALAQRMRWCVEHPELVRAMHDACVDTAQDYSWAAYRDRVTEVIASVVEGTLPV